MSLRTYLRLLALVACAAVTPVSAADGAGRADAAATRAKGIPPDVNLPGGLAIHVGTTDGRLEAALAESGRTLIHSLALDDAAVLAARKAILAKGLYGVASVERWRPAARLPYADNLANLVIAEQAAMKAGGIGEEEVLRIVAPGGRALLGDGAGWRALAKRWPADVDDWTHFDYDCTNNGISRDRRVGPVTTLKWIAGYRTERYHKSQTMAFRSWGGVLAHEWRLPDAAGGKPTRLDLLCGRDAFNGIRYWHMPIRTGMSSMVAADGRLFAMANPSDPLGPMRAYDLRTGRELLTFSEGGRLETPRQAGGDGHAYGSGAPRWVRILYHAGRLFQAANDTLYALDPNTGKRLWSWTDPDGRRLLFATYAPDLGLVLVANTLKYEPAKSGKADQRMPGDWGEWNSRWPSSRMTAITAFDAATGRQAWQCRDVAGQTASQLIYDKGNLAYFSASGIGAMGNKRDTDEDSWAWMGVVDARTGRGKWARNYRKDKPQVDGKEVRLGFAFTIILRDGVLHVGANNYMIAFEAETGKLAGYLVPPIPNARCTRPRQTVDWQIMGFGTFIARDFRGMVIQNIARSDCMTGPTPANGMTYHTPNGCMCFAQSL